MVPLLQEMSVWMTFASATRTLCAVAPAASLMRALAVEGVEARALHDLPGRHVSGNHVVLEDRLEGRPVLGQKERLDGPLRKGSEGLVGRGKDRERALSLECGDEPAGLERGCERLERAGRDGRIDDVFLREGGRRRGGAAGGALFVEARGERSEEGRSEERGQDFHGRSEEGKGSNGNSLHFVPWTGPDADLVENVRGLPFGLGLPFPPCTMKV